MYFFVLEKKYILSPWEINGYIIYLIKGNVPFLLLLHDVDNSSDIPNKETVVMFVLESQAIFFTQLKQITFLFLRRLLVQDEVASCFEEGIGSLDNLIYISHSSGGDDIKGSFIVFDPSSDSFGILYLKLLDEEINGFDLLFPRICPYEMRFGITHR
jgi:hypothetical protein